MTLGVDIVTDLAVVAITAALVTYVFGRLRQPLILGYLVAGKIIGPYTPPFSLVSRIDYLQTGADLGVILLLFGVGLQFPLKKLRSVSKVSVGVSVVCLLSIPQSTFGSSDAGFGNILLLVPKVLLFEGGSIVIGILVVPRLIDRLASIRQNEVLLLL